MTVRRSWGLAVCLFACLPRAGGYRCDIDADCIAAGQPGSCEAVGYCSFPDPSCTDGRRFGDLAAGYSGQCVDSSAVRPDAPAGFFYVGGTVVGLAASGLVLRNNGRDDLALSGSGPFSFVTALADGASYDVKIQAQPVGVSCAVSAASGVVSGAEVTTVEVRCAPATFELPCNTGVTCNSVAQLCCANVNTGVGTCLAIGDAASCGDRRIYCDDATDCEAGSVCCATYDQGAFKEAKCKALRDCTASGTKTVEQWCDPLSGQACLVPQTCSDTPVSVIGPARFHVCQ